MATEKEKMLAGALYDAMDPQLVAERRRARALCDALNALPAGAHEGERRRIMDQLFARSEGATVTTPFHCDYGVHTELGPGVYFNFNCVILDVCKVTVGANTLFGPGVQIYAATHPMSAELRRSGLESGKPVTVGRDVWVGGGAILCPGVTVGDGAVIGAGSVVTRDIPPGVFAAGNPCRVLRSL